MAEIRRTIQNLDPGQRYLIRSRSVNPYGLPSSWSEALDYSVPGDATIPEPPVDLVANFDGRDAILTWVPPDVSEETISTNSIKGYNIYITSPGAPTVEVSYFTATNQFIYFYAYNQADFATAQSSLEIAIKTVTISDVESDGTETVVTNVTPTTPTSAPEVTPGIGSVLISLADYIYTNDLEAFIIERSADLLNYEEIGETFTNFYVDAPPASYVEYTYRYRVRDVFGQISGYSPVSDPVEVLLASTEADNVTVEVAGGISSTNVQDALEELDAELSAHIIDASDAHDASAISYAGSSTPGMAATDVESAIDELHSDTVMVSTDLSNHITDTLDAHDASAVSFSPVGAISSTDVQAAIAEVGGDVTTVSGDLSSHLSDTTDAHDATAISYGGSATPGLTAANVEDAIDQTHGLIADHIADTSDAHDASAISYAGSATAGMAATDVEAAIDELHSDVVQLQKLKTQTITAVIDGGGVAITTGAKSMWITVPWGCTITGWRLLADQTGSITLDIWKDTYTNFPPTVADTITGSAKPLISGAKKAESTTLTGWNPYIVEDNILEINVDSCTTITRVVLTLFVEVTV